jgi:hypothetical protein
MATDPSVLQPHPLPASEHPPAALLALFEVAEGSLHEARAALSHYDAAALTRGEALAARVTRETGAAGSSLTGTRWAVVPPHVRNIARELETVLRAVRTVVRDGVPFTDRGLADADDLLARAAELLRLTRDLLATDSRFLRDAVRKKGNGLVARASRYADAHEVRLIQGVCMPQASSHFLAIVDALRAIDWHVRDIAARVAPGGGRAA